MRELVRSVSTFSNLGLLHQSRSDAQYSQKKKSITKGDTLAKKQLSMPIAKSGQNTKARTTSPWSNNDESKTPDGKFGPAKQLIDGNDSWFLSSIAAVVNDLDGNRKLAQCISRAQNGYTVKFAALPNFGISVSDDQLNRMVNTWGGDADTRILELAALNYFRTIQGGYKRLYLNACEKLGAKKDQAEKSFDLHCHNENIKDPMSHNPMRTGGNGIIGLFLLTGKYPDNLYGNMKTDRNEIMKYLKEHVKNNWDHPSVILEGKKNPLGNGRYSSTIVTTWDAIRTDITSDGMVDSTERTFLEALDKYLSQQNKENLKNVFQSAKEFCLRHVDPLHFLDLLDMDFFYLEKENIELLQYGIRDILNYYKKPNQNNRVGSNSQFGKSSGGVQSWSGTGFIGFSGMHTGYLTGIDEEQDIFTYSEPMFPTIQHTGILSRLIAEIQLSEVALSSVEPEVIDCPIY